MTDPSPHDRAIGQAKSALELFDDPVRKNAFGDVDGVDGLSIALDRMADALASLVEYPRTGETTLEDVIAFMSPDRAFDRDTDACLFRVREGIKLATYRGVSAQQIKDLNEARADLHRRLRALIDARERQGNDA